MQKKTEEKSSTHRDNNALEPYKRKLLDQRIGKLVPTTMSI